MTDTADVLEQYLVAIESTDYRKLAQWEKLHIVRSLRLLAAEVRRLREKLAAQEQLAGSAVTTDDVLRVWMQRMERASGQALDVKLATALACITELETENVALRRQL
jgi:DNA-binding transcriptional regulator YiaG